MSRKWKEWFWDFGEYAFSMEKTKMGNAYDLYVIYLFMFFSIVVIINRTKFFNIRIEFILFGIMIGITMGYKGFKLSLPTKFLLKKLGGKNVDKKNIRS